MTSIPTTPQVCPRCTDVATTPCTDCKNTSYCSPECQQADLPVHRSVCKLFQAFSTTLRPAPNMRRVIVFLPQNKEPQFMWATVKGGSDYGETMWPGNFINDPKYVSWRPIAAFRNGWTGMKLGYGMQVFHDDGFLDKYQRNGPASLFAATQGLDAAGWCGPMMVCCQSLPDVRYSNHTYTSRGVKVLDMDTLAFSHLASFLVDHSNVESDHLFRKGPKVQCVELSCSREGTEAHRVVCLPRTHPHFQKESVVSEISKKLQEPLRTWSIDTETSMNVTNDKIWALHQGADADLLISDSAFNLGIGTHLVARVDDQPLTGDTANAMADFCRFHLEPYVKKDLAVRSSEHHKDPMTAKRESDAQLTPEKWRTYFAQWQAEHAGGTSERAYTIEKARAGKERMGLTEDDRERLMSVLFNNQAQYLAAYEVKYGGPKKTAL